MSTLLAAAIPCAVDLGSIRYSYSHGGCVSSLWACRWYATQSKASPMTPITRQIP